jgi:hypothetical protein
VTVTLRRGVCIFVLALLLTAPCRQRNAPVSISSLIPQHGAMCLIERLGRLGPPERRVV